MDSDYYIHILVRDGYTYKIVNYLSLEFSLLCVHACTLVQIITHMHNNIVTYEIRDNSDYINIFSLN